MMPRLVGCSLVLILGCGGETSQSPDAAADAQMPDATKLTDAGDGIDVITFPDVSVDHGVSCDAGGLVCGSTCIDPTTDPSNCGACGHDCLGGACVASTCQPVVLATVSNGAGSLWRIATDGTYVVFTVFDTFANGGGVFSVSTSGANQTPLAVASSSTNQWAADVTIANGHVYWLQDDPSQNTAWTGNAGTASSANHLSILDALLGAGSTWTTYGITVDSTESYLDMVDFFSTADGGSRYTRTISHPLKTTGISADDIGVSSGPGANIVTDGTTAYFTLDQAGWVDSLDHSGLVSIVTSNQSSPNWVALDTAGNLLYWSTSTQIMKFSFTSPFPAAVANASVSGLVADSKGVYWTDASMGTISFRSLTASTPTTLAGSLAKPGPLAKDSQALYWLDTTDGTVRKIAL